jgi:hypothetical protein
MTNKKLKMKPYGHTTEAPVVALARPIFLGIFSQKDEA